jgi:fumarate reductase (CoM/CoB) subunit A
MLGATLRNRQGERFMLDYDRERAESTTRDVAARAIYDQIHAGNDVLGGVRLDVTELSDEDWLSSNPRPAKYFADRNLDFRQVTMILAPEAHFFMGGVVVDGNGQSRINGLYAVGETAGGAHGANRLDSNAIPEGQVFGARAGDHAARRALLAGRPASAGEDREAIAGDPAAAQDPSIEAIRRELQTLMGHSFGIVRTAAGLESGLRGVEALEERALLMRPGNARQQAQFVELNNSLLVARACLTAGLTRAESRGAHYRSDRPDRNDAQWQRALRIELLPEEGLRLQASELVAA